MTKRNQLIIIVLILTIIGVLTSLTSTYFIKAKIAEGIIEEETKNNLTLAKQTALLLEKEVLTIEEKVNLITKFPEIQDGNTETCNKKLAEVAPYLTAQIDNITRFNTKLTLDCAINQKAIGYVLTPDSPITGVIKDPNHSAYLSYAGFSPITNQQVLYLNLPVFNSKGSYSGIIGGVIYLNYIADKYLKDITLSGDSYATLIDDNKNILYHPDLTLIGKNFDSPEVMASTSANPILPNLNTKVLEDIKNNKSGSVLYAILNRENIAVYAPANVFPNRKWTVILTVPVRSILTQIESNVVFGGLNFFVSLSSAIILIFLLFSALILFFIIHGLFKPLIKIKEATEKIGHGDSSVGIDRNLLIAENEFGQLARAVQGMNLKIKESYSLSEQKVEQRTQELNKAKSSVEEEIKKRTAELEALRASLEETVKERTSALEARAKELERNNRFMVDREVAMVALKEENKELKRILNDAKSK